MVTIKDVARHANVSIATVSRVINGASNAVRPETKERVMVAIQSLGFVPNDMARGLHRNQSKTIGLIIPDISNPYYPSIVKGVEEEARVSGFTVILANTYRSRERTAHYLNVFREKRVDGIIFTGGGLLKDASEDPSFAHIQIPLVFIGKQPIRKLPTVQINNIFAAREACEYLLKSGHRRIATIAGPEDSETAEDRLEGYKQAFEGYGLAVNPNWIFRGTYEHQSGYEAVQSLFAQGNDDITAILAQNDMMAIGAMKALSDHGKNIPSDVAVMGFDNIPLSSFVTPRLSSVTVPVYEMGRRAMNILLDLIYDREGMRIITLPTKLAIRESCSYETTTD